MHQKRERESFVDWYYWFLLVKWFHYVHEVYSNHSTGIVGKTEKADTEADNASRMIAVDFMNIMKPLY